MFALKIDGRYVAFDYMLKQEGRLTGIRADYDSDYKKLMPGHYLKTAILKDLINRDGIWEYDMGGDDAGYKLNWTDHSRQHLNIMKANNLFYGKMLIKAKKMLPVLKSLIKLKNN